MDSATVMAEFMLTQQVIVASPTVPRKFLGKAQLTWKYKNLSFPIENFVNLYLQTSQIFGPHTHNPLHGKWAELLYNIMFRV